MALRTGPTPRTAAERERESEREKERERERKREKETAAAQEFTAYAGPSSRKAPVPSARACK